MDVSAEQPQKQLSPKLITDDGMWMDVSAEQPQKQLSPKLITDDGMTVFLHP